MTTGYRRIYFNIRVYPTRKELMPRCKFTCSQITFICGDPELNPWLFLSHMWDLNVCCNGTVWAMYNRYLHICKTFNFNSFHYMCFGKLLFIISYNEFCQRMWQILIQHVSQHHKLNISFIKKFIYCQPIWHTYTWV